MQDFVVDEQVLIQVAEIVGVIVRINTDSIESRSSRHSISISSHLLLSFHRLEERLRILWIEEGTFRTLRSARLVLNKDVVIAAIDLQAAILRRSPNAHVDYVDVLLDITHGDGVIAHELPITEHGVVQLVGEAFAFASVLVV